MKTLIQELEQKTISELNQVVNKHPYIAIYRMVLAKKLKHEGSTKAFNQALAKASLRVPSRMVLKEYLEQDLYSDEIITTEKNKVIFESQQAIVEDKVEYHQEEQETIAEQTNQLTAIALASTPIIGATLSTNESNTSNQDENSVTEIEETNISDESIFEELLNQESEDGEDIEVEIYQDELTTEHENSENIQTDNSIEEGLSKTLTESTKSIDNEPVNLEHEESDIEVEIYELDATQQDELKSINTTESETPSEEALNDSSEIDINQEEEISLQSIEDSNTETTTEENSIEENTNSLDIENQNIDEPSQKGLTIDEFQETLNVKQKDALFHYDGFDDDDIERIGDELIHEEEIIEQLKLDNDQRVEDLKVGENDSVYKKVVEILKQDSYNFNPTQETTSHIISSSDIVDESIEELHESRTENEEIIEQELKEKTAQEEEIQALNNKLDEELDLLYAQSSYESSLEYEIQEMQKSDEAKQVKEKEPIEEETQSIQIQEKVETQQENSLPRKDSHSFFAWLDKFSAQKQENKINEEKRPTTSKIKKQEEIQAESLKNDEPKEVLQEEKKQKIDFKQEEVDNQYRDSDDDLDDELTKEVQKKAKKSMTENRSYYTETLAYIYELQDKWEKAIEVYQELILKNPEKSAYFASQIKLLREKIETE